MSKTKTGIVYLVGAGPGDEGLITVRGAALLRQADVVLHDALANRALLRYARSGAEIVSVGHHGADRTLDQAGVNQRLVDEARAGKAVVRLKGGDPFVFGRGAEEIEFLVAHQVPFEVVPGVSSFHSVPAAAGIPLTHRGLASAFTVVTGHEDPAKPGAAVDWTQVARVHGTKVVLMGAERLPVLITSLIDGGMDPATPAAFVQWGTTARQRTVTGTLADLAARVAQAGLASPAVLVVGPVVTLRDSLNWFERRPLFGHRIAVTRTREQAGELGTRFSQLGADILEIPTLRIVHPTERQSMIEALAGLGEYDWVVFSSVNGVESFFNAFTAAFDDLRSLGNLRFAAVGTSTAARLKERHLKVDAMPTDFLGKHIAAAIAEVESLENLRVLVARAQKANPDLCRELEERGAIVDDVPFYQTVAETEDRSGDAARLVAEGADWITFTSSSTVEHFNQRFDLAALLKKHARTRLASIGPETSKTLRGLGFKPQAEADPHTLDGLVEAVIKASIGVGTRD